MISFFQAIILGLVQGITELFPISSLGHSVILPGLLGWHFDQNADAFLTFLVATHFATALTLLYLYRKDWKDIITGTVQSLTERDIKTNEAKLGWFIVVSTIPAALAGVLFEQQIQRFFIAPTAAAFFLTINGIMLFGAEALRKRAKHSPASGSPDTRIVEKLSFAKSFAIGCTQIVALIPGFSRTGATLSGGLLVNLSREDALRYSFLLATPIILAAAALKLPPLLLSGNSQTIAIAATGALCAAIAAYGSATFLTRYFKTNTLWPFAAYCFFAGILSLIFLK